ncbi:MAG: UbiA-like polyprenyltransferase [Armatimonadota bacterium]|nr:UbiA-like polyprenyltransferase [Armatimonadota bacterium]
MKSLIVRGLRKLKIILEMIKFEHTIFALPFALMSMMLAADGLPERRVIIWILVAMVGARSSAMAFNRIADLTYDRLNPRTADRALPKGILSVGEVWLFTFFSAVTFVFASYMLNSLAFALSPLALLIILGYSYTKRFTSLTHLVLGLALGIAPVGAWIAVRGQFNIAPIVLSAAVMFWTAGFDIIYALQDIEFDRQQGLFSIPRFLGINRSLIVSKLFHFTAVLLLILFGATMHLGWAYFAGTLAAAVLLAYEQSLVKPNDLSKVNVAFFNTNGFVSIGLFVFALLDLLIRKGVI